MILFYAAQNNPSAEKVEQQFAEYKTVRCSSFETMDRRLRRPRHGLEVVLVLAKDREEIYRLEEIHGLLRDLRLVLVLPDRDTDMVSRAHKLSPRFIAYADQSLGHIGAVISRMMGAARSRLVKAASAVAETARDERIPMAEK